MRRRQRSGSPSGYHIATEPPRVPASSLTRLFEFEPLQLASFGQGDGGLHKGFPCYDDSRGVEPLSLPRHGAVWSTNRSGQTDRSYGSGQTRPRQSRSLPARDSASCGRECSTVVGTVFDFEPDPSTTGDIVEKIAKINPPRRVLWLTITRLRLMHLLLASAKLLSFDENVRIVHYYNHFSLISHVSVPFFCFDDPST